MSQQNRHECPDCETVFIGTPRCPGCGWSPTALKKPAEFIPETHRPAQLPAEPEAAPAEHVKAELAKVWALLGGKPERDERVTPPKRVGLPPVDPAVRAEVERVSAESQASEADRRAWLARIQQPRRTKAGAESVGALLGRVR